MLLNTSENTTRCDHFQPPFHYEGLLYQTSSGLNLAGSVYIFVSLICYELGTKGIPKSGRRLRVLCACATGTCVMHALSELFIVTYASDSVQSCSTLMSIKSTLFNITVSWTYMFLWCRQRTLYANSAIKRLRKKWMELAMWVILAVLIVNPFVMLISQQTIDLFGLCGGVCVVLRVSLRKQIPLIIVASSYTFIQVCEAKNILFLQTKQREITVSKTNF